MSTPNPDVSQHSLYHLYSVDLPHTGEIISTQVMCIGVCICHIHSLVVSYLCVYVCRCMLTQLNDCGYIRQQDFVLKQFCILIQLHHAILSIRSLPMTPTKRKSPTEHTNCISSRDVPYIQYSANCKYPAIQPDIKPLSSR